MSVQGREGGYRKSFLVENLGHTEWIPENSLGKYAIYFNNINSIYSVPALWWVMSGRCQ